MAVANRQRKGQKRKTHGQSYGPEYQAWKGIKRRCLNAKAKNYHHYGGRGITVCDAWRDSFAAFFAYVGPRPSPKHSIDRYPDNNGNYEPGNVRWATQSQQCRNTRANRQVEYRGERMPLVALAERTGIEFNTLKNRIASWGVGEAVATPPPSSQFGQNRGEHAGSAKLTAAQVVNIRAKAAAGATLAALAKEFGVTDGCIRKIVTRKTWRHLP